MFLKNKLFLFSKKTRHNYLRFEIFSYSSYILEQCHYSTSLSYFNFKCQVYSIFLTKIKNNCIYSSSSRSVNKNLRISNLSMIRQHNKGLLTGVFHSV